MGNCNAVSHNLSHFYLPKQKGILLLSASPSRVTLLSAVSLANICSPICIFGARDNSPLFFSMNERGTATHNKQASVVVVDILTISAYFALVGFLAYRAYATRSFSIHPIYISAAAQPGTRGTPTGDDDDGYSVYAPTLPAYIRAKECLGSSRICRGISNFVRYASERA